MATLYQSAAGQQRHTGFVYQSPIVLSVPPDLRKKIQRSVASKLIMAARADLKRSFQDGKIVLRTSAEMTADLRYSITQVRMGRRCMQS